MNELINERVHPDRHVHQILSKMISGHTTTCMLAVTENHKIDSKVMDLFQYSRK